MFHPLPFKGSKDQAFCSRLGKTILSKSGQVKGNSLWSWGICTVVTGAVEPVLCFLADSECMNLMRHFSVLSLPAEG